ncbi:MAG: DUF4276 family protein [Terracidiphilus sp.]
MIVQIFVEGGGDARTTLTKCREGFSTYCSKLAPANHRPSIVACGGRQQAFDRFKTAVQTSRGNEICVLLVDAEDRVAAATPVEHLRSRDRWDFPALQNHRVFLMVQAMEAWFFADRKVLAEFYDGGFLANSLPGSPTNIEVVLKDDLEPKLKHASSPTKTKGEYHKTKHGFELLGKIDPVKIEDASPHAKQFNEFLRGL